MRKVSPSLYLLELYESGVFQMIEVSKTKINIRRFLVSYFNQH